MKSLSIRTSDKQTFKVDWDVAWQSHTIRTMLDDLNIEEDSDSEDTIPLPNEEVTGPVFKKALEWCKKNRGKPDDDESDELTKQKNIASYYYEQLNDSPRFTRHLKYL